MNFLGLSSHELLVLLWGGLIQLVLVTITSFISIFIKRIVARFILLRILPYDIRGIWYSAEYDIKDKYDRETSNTYLRVEIERGLFHSIIVKVTDELDRDPARLETRWIAKGKIGNHNTLIGTWHSTIKYTNRYGTVILKFLDNGRAAGYWTGYGYRENPGYGYWILSREYNDAKILASTFLDEKKFKWIDAVEFVKNYPVKRK